MFRERPCHEQFTRTSSGRAGHPRPSAGAERIAKLDERRQRALTRYYVESGAGGVAVGVHTTQFEIRLPQFGLLRPVLELASRTVDEALERIPGPS